MNLRIKLLIALAVLSIAACSPRKKPKKSLPAAAQQPADADASAGDVPAGDSPDDGADNGLGEDLAGSGSGAAEAAAEMAAEQLTDGSNASNTSNPPPTNAAPQVDSANTTNTGNSQKIGTESQPMPLTDIAQKLDLYFSVKGYDFTDNRRLPAIIEAQEIAPEISRIVKIFTVNAADQNTFFAKFAVDDLSHITLPANIPGFASDTTYRFAIEYNQLGKTTVTKLVQNTKGTADFNFNPCFIEQDLSLYFRCFADGYWAAENLHVYERFSGPLLGMHLFGFGNGITPQGLIGNGFQTAGNRLMINKLDNLSGGDFALSLWLKPSTDDSGNQVIWGMIDPKNLSNSDQWLVLLLKNSKLRIFGNGRLLVEYSVVLGPGQWHNVIVDYNRELEILKLFFDGEPQEKIAFDHKGIDPNEQVILIGSIIGEMRDANPLWRDFAGTIDELALWRHTRLSNDNAQRLFRQQGPWLDR